MYTWSHLTDFGCVDDFGTIDVYFQY